MEPFATSSDVADLWRPLSSAEDAQAYILLGRASAMLRLAVPGIDARVAADVNLADIVRGVVVDAVLRVMKNPDGKKSESIDDYSWTRDGSIASGTLYLSAAEIALASPVEPSLDGAYVVSLGG